MNAKETNFSKSMGDVAYANRTLIKIQLTLDDAWMIQVSAILLKSWTLTAIVRDALWGLIRTKVTQPHV
jgi:hypothetical protein